MFKGRLSARIASPVSLRILRKPASLRARWTSEFVLRERASRRRRQTSRSSPLPMPTAALSTAPVSWRKAYPAEKLPSLSGSACHRTRSSFWFLGVVWFLSLTFSLGVTTSTSGVRSLRVLFWHQTCIRHSLRVCPAAWAAPLNDGESHVCFP